MPAKFFGDFKSCYEELLERSDTLFVMESAGGEDLAILQMPEKSAFIFGNEEFGHRFNNDDYPRIQSLKIPQAGKVESLNVSIAASIVMYEYTKQHGSGQLFCRTTGKLICATNFTVRSFPRVSLR
jgi:tRNA G18 (ribose-2'-O)-methylase SpoU